MKKKIISLLVLILLLFCTMYTFALYRNTRNGIGTIKSATWSVTRSQSQSGDSINVIPGGSTDTYELTVESNSEVDVKYKIIISNLPSGVEVDLDNTGFLTPTVNGDLVIENANTIINYNDVSKTKVHTLTFRAVSGTEEVLNQEIDIDVEFSQVV